MTSCETSGRERTPRSVVCGPAAPTVWMQHYLRGEGIRAKPRPLRFLASVPSVFQSRPPGFIVTDQGSPLAMGKVLLRPISSGSLG
jgi:hypothetical protein